MDPGNTDPQLTNQIYPQYPQVMLMPINRTTATTPYAPLVKLRPHLARISQAGRAIQTAIASAVSRVPTHVIVDIVLAVLCFIAFCFLGSWVVRAQSGPPATLELLSAGSPPQVPGVSISATGSGNSTYCYWVVPTYPIGVGPVSTSTCATTVPVLSAGAPIIVSWPPAPGATSYRVLRTTTPTYPAGVCSLCSLTTTTGTAYTDTGGAGTNYTTPAVAAPAKYTLSLDNVTANAPVVRTQLGGTSYIQPQVAGAPVAGNCVTWAANGNIQDAGTTCGSGAGGVTTAVTLTANLPVIGAGGTTVAIGSRSGNTTKYATFTGAAPAGDVCAQVDSAGNLKAFGTDCYQAANGVIISAYAVRGTCTSANAGQIAQYTDSVLNSICQPISLVWRDFYAGNLLTLPWTNGTWINQGGSTIDGTAGYSVMTFPAGTGSANLRYQVKALPATPFTITLAMTPGGYWSTYDLCGLILRESSSDKSIAFSPWSRDGGSGTVYQTNLYKYSAGGTFSAAYQQLTGQPTPFSPLWFVRVADDGVTRTWSVASTAVGPFVTLTTNGHTDYMTADQYGYGCDAQGSAGSINGLFYHLLLQ